MSWLLKLLALAVVAIWVAVFTLPDDKLHVVFCDVGQGDAVLVYQKSIQMLIDAGPNDRALGCLTRHIPFWDRTIEVALLTHPQADHMNGFINVVERYDTLQFVIPVVENETSGYQQLRSKVQGSRSKVVNVYAGDEVRLGQVKFGVVWPERGFVMAHVVGDSGVLGAKTDGTDLNSFSIGGILSFGQFDVLLTGDADRQIEEEMMAAGGLREVEVLKVPHHGSKTGMTVEWLEKVAPQLAVISVGKNSYGHPAEETMTILRDKDIRILRTDVEGDVEVVSDGVKWWVNENRD